MSNKSGIYCIMNISNNKKYIGSSICIYSRWKQHKTSLRRGNHQNRYLQASWNKYGESNFRFFIIEEIQAKRTSELFEREDYYMKIYNSLNGDYGYNIDLAGCKTEITDRSNIKYRPIIILNKDGVFIKEFISMAEASRELNVNMKRLDEVLHGRENGSKKRFRVNGFIPVYKNLYNKEIQYSHKANRGIKVVKLDSDKNVVDTYDNANDATIKTGINRANIYEAIYNGNMHKGFYYTQVSKSGEIMLDNINDHNSPNNTKKVKRIVVSNDLETIHFNSIKEAMNHFGMSYDKVRYIRLKLRGGKIINGYKWEYE